jgi:hypothetical protein
MLEVISALKGYAIEATDGGMGTVSDFLFDDRNWRVRWLVVDTGTWLTERKVLVHPSAIKRADDERQTFAVNLTKAQVEGGPGILQDQPVSRQMERQLHDYYGSDPLWSDAGAMAAPFSTSPYFGFDSTREEAPGDAPVRDDGDPHLRGIAEVTGYRIHAADGEIGHVEDFLLDSATWSICYLAVDTRNWWPGKHVLMSPHAVENIDWSERHIRLNVTRDQVMASPPWDPLALMNQAGMKRLDAHYGWPGLASRRADPW